MRRRTFQAEPKVFLVLLAVGVVGMPALVWRLTQERISLWAFYNVTAREVVTFGRDWWGILIAVLIPAFLFEVGCTIVWAFRNRKALSGAAKASSRKKKNA